MRDRGFTIIEMLIVLSLIGSVAMLIMPFVISARFKADYAACISNERNLAQSLEMIKNIDGVYPENMGRIVTSGHMARIPVCPSNRRSYATGYEVNDKKNRYTIWCPGIHNLLLKYLKPRFPRYSSVYGIDLGEMGGKTIEDVEKEPIQIY